MAVALGLPGAWAADSDRVDALASRVGGVVVVPTAAKAAFASRDLLCKVCTSTLQLLLQVHAPCTEDQVGQPVQDRNVFLLGCSAAKCGTAAGSWRAFRLQSGVQPNPPGDAGANSGLQTDQSQQHAAVPAAAEPLHSGTDPAARDTASISGGFGFGATSFSFDSNSRPADSGASSDPMLFADLDNALSGISSAGGATAAAIAPRQSRDGSSHAREAPAGQHAGGSEAAADAVRLQRGASLPEFYISWRDEPEAAPDELRPADAAHIASLVDQYEADHEMADAPGEGWSGEAYEADTLPGGDSSFPKFSKRLQRAPQQCLRYSFGGSILWPKSPPPQPPSCTACGAPRVFELQAMPALHTALGEGLQWQNDSGSSGGGGTGSQLSIDAWSWLTIAVFTCSKSCSVGTGYRFVEEHVVLADE